MHKEKKSSRKMDYTSREEVLMNKQHADRNGTKQENGGWGGGGGRGLHCVVKVHAMQARRTKLTDKRV